jgi:two-component system, NtrC family, C4-dicarboxylate transport response regulator DctD
VALGLDTGDSFASVSLATDQDGLKKRVGQYEAALIEEALEAAHGDVQEVLVALDLPRKTFYDKVARHGIDLARYKVRSS